MALCGVTLPFPRPGGFPNKGNNTQQTKGKQMQASEILNGNLENDIREGLKRLNSELPPQFRASISIHLYGQERMCSFIGVSVDGVDLGSAGYGSKTIPEAVEAVIAAYNDPKAVEERRKKVQEKIATLQSELDALNTVGKGDGEEPEPLARRGDPLRYGLYEIPGTEHNPELR